MIFEPHNRINTNNRNIKMMTMILKRKKLRRSEEDMLPNLINSPTGSTSSSEDNSSPPPSSSSSRIQQKFAGLIAQRRSSTHQYQHHQHQHQHQHRNHSSPTSRSHRRRSEEVTDTSILMGAEIIRQQLSINSSDSPTRKMKSSSSRGRDHCRRSNPHAKNSAGRTSIDKDDWDPWMVEKGAQRDRNGTKNTQVNEDDGDNDDTLKILEQANAVIFARGHTFENTNPKHEKRNDEKENKNKKNTKNKNNNCMVVQRVSEMDNSTFASSSSGGGYLPTNLMASFACGTGLNTGLNTTIELPSPKSFKTDNTEDEDIETSTLDFLANLHVQEEELNLIFNSFEEEQQELCAQSKSHNPSSAAVQPKLRSFHSPSKKKPSTTNDRTTRTLPNQSQEKAPRITAAAAPFEKMVSPRSSFYDQLLQDPAYCHALKAGTLWQW